MSGEEIVRTYSDMIYGVAMRYVRDRYSADEVYSDVFYKYFLRERTFENEEHRKAWLLRVTINCCKDYLGKQTYHEELQDDMFASVQLSGTSEASLEEILDVRNALKRLREDYREVIELFYFDQLTVTEISRMLQMPVGTVKSHLLRGRNELKSMLTSEGDN